MQLFDDLQKLSSEQRAIRVGLVGAGFMGKGIVEVIESVIGMNVVAISDIEREKAADCYRNISFDNYKEIKRARDAQKVLFPEERIIAEDYKVITELEGIDIVIEATGVPQVGAEVAFNSIMNKRHIGMLNVETDVTIGYHLSSMARRMGVVYTVCTGDEPAAIKELYDFAKTLGFTVIACGKGKNNPLDVTATPSSLKEQAHNKGLNPKILTEFVDGTKTMVEMSCIANAACLTVDKRNMHGPHVNIDELAKTFCKKTMGGILECEGVVDYAIGDVAPGIFVVVKHKGKVVNETMKYLRIGDGPQFLLYRPYHLTNIEVPISVAMASLYHKPSIAAGSSPTTEVITIAKRDLKRGDSIDCIGGCTVYGGIERYGSAKKENLLPLGISEGAELVREVKKGDALVYKDVKLKDTLLYYLRKIQDSYCRDNANGQN